MSQNNAPRIRSTPVARWIIAAAGVLWLLVPCEAPAAARRPNVILIMIDDLGYHDLSCYGHEKIRTPVLDKLAADGIRLTSFYAGSTVCTPSRMALLTGAYPPRVGWTKGVIGYKMDPRRGLNPKVLTVAEIFRSAGYATGMCGKWHLGDRPACLPAGQGFDFSYYITKSNNQTKQLWRGSELLEKRFDNRRLTEQFTREAVRFIREEKDKPFFLYLPYTAPHFPVQAHPDWKGKSKFGEYGDVVEELDARIGTILKTLADEKLDKNTLVVFLSDNGPQGGQAAQATPYRGLKWEALEGGYRVPCIVRLPGKIPPGQVSDALVGAIDLLPTLCQACGIDVKSVSKGSPVIDGVNVWDTLCGKKTPHPRNDLLFWHGMGQFQAIRVGQWKLFLNRQAAARQNKVNSAEVNRRAAELAKGSGPVLFNLARDPRELTDLSAKYPEKVNEMQALARKRLADIKSNVVPLAE